MADKVIPDNIMTALVENTKTIDANTQLITNLTAEKDKKDTNEKNIVSVNKVEANLTGDERKRYANIGKELFKPLLSSLENLLKREKKKKEMLIQDDASTINKAVKIQYDKESSPEKEKSSWLTTLLLILGAIRRCCILF